MVRTKAGVDTPTIGPQREDMATSDSLEPARGSAWRRFRGIMRWMSLAAIASAAAAVWLVTRGELDVRVHMLIAIALGAGLLVLLAAALMTPVFIGSGRNQGEEARGPCRAQGEKDE